MRDETLQAGEIGAAKSQVVGVPAVSPHEGTPRVLKIQGLSSVTVVLTETDAGQEDPSHQLF